MLFITLNSQLSILNLNDSPAVVHHLSVEQVDNSVRHHSVVLRVGHHHDGGAFGVELREQFHHGESALRVEITCRLVGEDELRLAHHGTCYSHTLLLTAGELLRIMLGTLAESHLAQNLGHSLAAFL